MSMPNLPENNDITREEAVNLILASIAMEELGMSHILNAEGEKLQYVLGTVEGTSGLDEPPTVEDILGVNKSVRQTLSSATRLQMMLGAKMESAMSTSTMQGPEGPKGETGEQGPIGPTGPRGFEGPRGPTGSQGIQGIAGTVGTIKGSYDTEQAMRDDNPQGGLPGDFYYIYPDLWVWDENKNDWLNVGEIAGPQGLQGIQGERGDAGPIGPKGDTGAQGSTGPKGDTGAQGSTGPKGNTGERGSIGPKGDTGEQGPAGVGIGLIPFATGAGAVGLLDSRNGFATNVILTGFGASSKIVSISGSGFTLPTGDGFFFPISMAHAVTIKSIYFTTANWAAFTPGGGSTITPYIILAVANQGESTFTFLNTTRTDVAVPWRGGSEIPANSTLYGSRININQPISAGARLAICCAFDMKNGNPPLIPYGYFFYYAGSIYYE